MTPRRSRKLVPLLLVGALAVTAAAGEPVSRARPDSSAFLAITDAGTADSLVPDEASLRGQVVESLVDQTVGAGHHSVTWDARRHSSGVVAAAPISSERPRRWGDAGTPEADQKAGAPERPLPAAISPHRHDVPTAR